MKRMRTARWFTLIGCIDKDELTSFKIGTSLKNYCPPKTGELTCYANDALNHYDNNSGSLSIKIERVK